MAEDTCVGGQPSSTSELDNGMYNHDACDSERASETHSDMPDDEDTSVEMGRLSQEVLGSHHDTGSESEEDRLSTSSISESHFEVIKENGRQYFNDTYYMPCDDAEQTRLNIIHQAYLLITGLYTADLSSLRSLDRVLDVGCGPGDWAIAMGQRFPHTEITAVDIGPFEIDPDDVPSNVHFLIDDVEAEWNYPHSFDYIHIRAMSGAFANWSFIYTQALCNLAPGGILEVTDWDYNWLGLESYDYLTIFSQAILSASLISGYPRTTSHLDPNFLASLGFSAPVHHKTLTIPFGPSNASNTISKMVTIALLEGIEAQSLRLLTKHKGWSIEQAHDLCSKVKLELTSPPSSKASSSASSSGSERLALKLYTVVAKKPD